MIPDLFIVRIVVDYIQNRALEETKAIFPQLRNRIQESLAKLEQQLVSLI